MPIFIATLDVTVEHTVSKEIKIISVYVQYYSERDFESSRDEQYGDIADDIPCLIEDRLGTEWSQIDVDTAKDQYYPNNHKIPVDIVVEKTESSDSE